MIRNLRLVLLGLVVLLMIALSGCSESDDGPTNIPEETGTIHIDSSPSSIDPPWTLSGPGDFNQSGNGNHTFSDRVVGDYLLEWGTVGGWIAPSASTLSLGANDTIRFSGDYQEDITVSDGFVLIPAGEFLMGSLDEEEGRFEGEDQHTVILTTRFEIFTTEVTNRQYADMAQWALEQGYCTATAASLVDNLDGSAVVLLNLEEDDSCVSFDEETSTFSVDSGKDDYPINFTSWYGAVAYCDWLSLEAGFSRSYDHATWQCQGSNPYGVDGFRLPTEAEWEYACRAGSTTAFANGEITDTFCEDPSLDLIGWYCGNSEDHLHPVAQLEVNSWGLYDMHGNLYEWCHDWYGSYVGGIETNPIGTSGTHRVIRSCGWSYNANLARSAARAAAAPENTSTNCGFRPVRSIP